MSSGPKNLDTKIETARILKKRAAATRRTPCRADETPSLPTLPTAAPAQEWKWERCPSSILEIPAPREGIVLFISDVHFDTHLEREMDILMRIVSDIKPVITFMAGDMWDFDSLGSFKRSPEKSAHRLQSEFNAGKPYIDEICRWSQRVLMPLGNHEDRLFRVMEDHPGLWGLDALNIHSIAKLPDKVEVVPYQRLVKCGDMHYFHGDVASTHTASATYSKLQCSVVVGHCHRPELKVFSHLNTQHTVVVNGTFQDKRKVSYTNFPHWGVGFTSVHYSEKRPGVSMMSPYLHLFNDGAVHIPGLRTYR